MTLELAKSILVLVAWPAAVLAIAGLVCSAPLLAARLDAFFFPRTGGGA